MVDVRAWFHGIFARSIPMPHVSVIPAKMRPAPMNAAETRTRTTDRSRLHYFPPDLLFVRSTSLKRDPFLCVGGTVCPLGRVTSFFLLPCGPTS
jgi:hypothetical protein